MYDYMMIYNYRVTPCSRYNVLLELWQPHDLQRIAPRIAGEVLHARCII